VYTVPIWIRSGRIVKWHEHFTETLPIDKVALHPTFKFFDEASQAARALSMAEDVLFAEVFDVKSEKVLEKWTCGCIEIFGDDFPVKVRK
jgi:hypothetical protein